MTLMAIKLKNGDDLLAYINADDGKSTTISDPMLVKIEPNHGFWVRDWLYLSEVKTATLKGEEIQLIHKASERSNEIYQEYIMSIRDRETNSDRYRQSDDYDTSEFEEIFETLLESKTSIKH